MERRKKESSHFKGKKHPQINTKLITSEYENISNSGQLFYTNLTTFHRKILSEYFGEFSLGLSHPPALHQHKIL